MSVSSAAEQQDADAAPLRKSRRSNNDTGYLGTLSDIVRLFSPERLPTMAEIEARIEDLKLNGTLSASMFEAGNSAFGRAGRLKRSATDDQLSSRVQKSRVTPPEQCEDLQHSDKARDGFSVSSSSTTRPMLDPHSRGDLTREFLKAVKTHCTRDVFDRIESLFANLHDGKTAKIVVWHQARELLKGTSDELLEQLDQVMRLTQHKPDGIELPRSIVRPPVRVPATMEGRRAVEVERIVELPRLDQFKLHMHSPRVSAAIKDFLDTASEVLRPQPQYREIMQRLAQYVIDGVSNLSEAEPLDAPSRPRYERGVKAIHSAMDYVQAYPDLHARLRQFLVAKEPERRPSISSGSAAAPAAAGAGSTSLVPASVAVASPAPATQVYATVSGTTAVPVQYVPPSYPYPMYEFSYMYGVGYSYPYAQLTVPAAHELKAPAATAYALPAGYPPYPIALSGQPGKALADHAHLPRGSTITYITAPPPGAGYALPPTVVSYAAGVPPGYVAGPVPYSAPYVTHSYAVAAPDPLRHVVTASSVTAAAAAAGTHHLLGTGASSALREPPQPSQRDTTHTIPAYLSPPSRAIVRDDATS